MLAKINALAICLLLALPLRAQEPADSVSAFKAKELIVPGALIAAGATFVAIPQAREWMHKEIGTHKVGSSDDYIRVLPLAAYELLGFTGLKCRRPIADRAIKGATATMIMAALTYGTKYCVHERRPDGSNLRSFPSGHTAAAFMGAELLRQDYGTWVGLGGYVVASGVGAMRIMGGHHWLNDVVAGAGIGILSARAAAWLLPIERRWFGLSRRPGECTFIIPSYSPATSAFSLTASITF